MSRLVRQNCINLSANEHTVTAMLITLSYTTVCPQTWNKNKGDQVKMFQNKTTSDMNGRIDNTPL